MFGLGKQERETQRARNYREYPLQSGSAMNR